MTESNVKTSAPSIFNDVLGPVMRGPSSSHTAASHRIGLMLRDLAGPGLKHALFEFHNEGSLASTHRTQGSDMGLAAGLIGMDILNEHMPSSLEKAKQAGLELSFLVADYTASHPNTYKCTLTLEDGTRLTARAESTGGGMFRFTEIEGFPLFLEGDEFVVFMLPESGHFESDIAQLVNVTQSMPGFIRSSRSEKNQETALIFSFSDESGAESAFQACNARKGFTRLIRPVMPIASNSGASLPFDGLPALMNNPELLVKSLGELGLIYETARSGFSRDKTDGMMKKLIAVWKKSIQQGLTGTEYQDRLMGSQVPEFLSRMKEGRLLPAGPLNRMIAYSCALMEMKSSMGIIVAAPTAGACGGLPGCLIGLSDENQLDDDILSRGFWAAGLVGIFIARGATFAAEVAGCQAETGAGASMAAAGLVEMAGGTAQEALDAASLALQNIIGLVCDPVANRVEIPCLGRNAAAAGNALTSANMILGGFDPVIPLEETIVSMLEVGKTMPHSLRCTALGGLAATPTAKFLESKLLC